MLIEVTETGKKIAQRFLQTPHLFYNDTIHYAETFTWRGALEFAAAVKDQELFSRLQQKFDLLFGEEKAYLPVKNHVDFNMFGCLPLSLYKLTGDERYRALGMPYADTQWETPPIGTALTEEQQAYSADGYTWQTRLWMDDMYMITVVQSAAYSVSGDRKYIDRTAREMVFYLDKLQRPDALFYHAPLAPFLWGRANGWMAAGMANLLKALGSDSPYRPRILQSYIAMMETLVKYQGPTGMWKQLIDQSGFWDESSCTGMFTYAMLTGVQNHWLSETDYKPVIQKAWNALLSHIDENGDVREVCAGTPTSDNRDFYYNRPRVTGDYHGQAPVLWCVNEVIRA
ncbi:hypothetical protein FACS1894151_07330 [Spirochaetia bacterium]|nr:hypothetical protein FACS1894151_07330 [Spirochaetia bacterium]